ncbi:aminodeoxychorismate synthase component I [Salinisphaera orenii]|uniref:aminodeoxychorismate synthase component I n=1 Tax=Salinisphaera orenii TaxID=856731 RepID=UPI0019550602
MKQRDDISVRRVAADGIDLAALAAERPDRYPFVFESSAGAVAQSRYDLALAFPDDEVTVDSPVRDGAEFFAQLGTGCGNVDSLPGVPFIGGWFFYLGYEMAGAVEPSLSLPATDSSMWPDAFAVRCPAAIVHDRQTGAVDLVCETPDDGRLAAMAADVADTPPLEAPSSIDAEWREQPPSDYCAAVDKARDYIRAGDIFQANLSRAWHGRLARETAPAELYAALRAANPAPFSGLLQWRDNALISTSPERLTSIDDGIIQTRPIAGTRPRRPDVDQDAVIADLLANPKERAEHVMLIDLERNDLGRVCTPGSVAVDELMVAESYARVHHIVSNIRGALAPEVRYGDALRAVFPGGTITGCPKVRCMQIIAELEAEPRGPYTGTFGYVSRCGRLDSNIVIRSISQRGRDLTLRTGGGIVADSSAEAELAETRAKARGVLNAFAAHGEWVDG